MHLRLIFVRLPTGHEGRQSSKKAVLLRLSHSHRFRPNERLEQESQEQSTGICTKYEHDIRGGTVSRHV